MAGEVLVALLVTGVLGDEVEVLAADDDGAVHLGGNDGAGQDTATDGDEAGEGALLVCCMAKVSIRLFACFPISIQNVLPLPVLQKMVQSLSILLFPSSSFAPWVRSPNIPM